VRDWVSRDETDDTTAGLMLLPYFNVGLRQWEHDGLMWYIQLVDRNRTPI
jgi:hypothetical protein